MDEETVSSYEGAGFGQSTPFGASPCVLVVDMCTAYFSQGSPLDLGQPQIIDSVRRLVEAGRSAGVPIVWTRVEFEPGGGNGGVWYDKIPALGSFDRGNPLGDWVAGLVPVEEEVVITKQHASGFSGTNLADQLSALNIDSVFACGVSTSGCVRATVTDASASGFVPFVVRQAVGDRTAEVNEANLFDLHAKYGDVIDEELAVAHLCNG